MSLATRLARYFTPTTQNRGQDYFWRDRVVILQGSESEVKAEVLGSRTYDVDLSWENGALTVSCECPYFADSGFPCKHLWAAILAGEKEGYLSAAASAKIVALNLDSLPEDFGELDLDPASTAIQVIAPSPKQPAQRPSAWRQQLGTILNTNAQVAGRGDAWPANREILYIVDVPASLSGMNVVLALHSREPKQDGSWKQERPLNFNRNQLAQLPRPEDREIISALAGGKQYNTYGYLASYDPIPQSFAVPHPLASTLMRRVALTGRCFLRLVNGPGNLTPLEWDDAGEWNLELEIRQHEQARWALTGLLRRGEERMDLAVPVLVTSGGLVFTSDRVAPLAEDTPFEWISSLRKTGSIEAPEKEHDELLAALRCAPTLPPLAIPDELRYEEVTLQPRPSLRISQPGYSRESNRLQAELSFIYEGRVVEELDPVGGFCDGATRRFLRRDSVGEKAAASLLDELGVKFRGPGYWRPNSAREIPASKLTLVVQSLVRAGWDVEAEGKIFRRPGKFHIEVSSGVDWFELHAKVQYGDSTAQLPELLEALRRGQKMVRLDDGAFGILPEDWLRRFAPLAGMGAPENSHIRFHRRQAGLLDALLAAQPEARCDETFAHLRRELQQFHGVDSAAQPAGFVGRLRDYQREGLGWMHFLRRFSFGGCLADDMGVGKTAQVLALLETRRESRAAGEQLGPSLVVVPKSLIFNWKQEAERFTPQLRVLDYTGLARNNSCLADYDVVLTTYGTLRQDALRLKDVEFDYVVLDEAQTVKNASTESAKAVRLLRGTHRLALSGTPIENHLGELWSLFEFLNPGMLGAASAFSLAAGAMRNPSDETRRLLAQALRPFILRRTKEQVARELPSKSEQTIYCEMKAGQRKLYDELRHHYRDSLLKRIENQGLAQSKIQVLAALLRLRQAACHPGLLDKNRFGNPAAKLDVLLEQLREVLDEGHKALVFSQFTSFLKIVRDRLDSNGIAYEYLDGATSDRQARVERFQSDPDCQLFLVSLKAGGLGLNLTAAEYVFILDPWWNPAVEAQAVDRAHRIGQTRQVFVYRLIARDTVEEKVLELQKSKRDLAAGIIGADHSTIRNLRSEDLELLLS